jgi:hypothetical protein
VADIDTDGLRRLAEAATPGSWSLDTNTPFSEELVGIFIESAKRYVVLFEDQDPGLCADPVAHGDAAYIAAMDPPTTLALLAEVVALREQVARVREMAGSWYQQGLLSASDYDVGGNHAAGAILAALGDST